MNTKIIDLIIYAVYNYLKAQGGSNSGIVDLVKIGARVFNYMSANGKIAEYEKDEYRRAYIIALSSTFHKGVPDTVKKMLYDVMVDERGYDDVARNISNSI